MKGMCFKALCVHANQQKALKLLESEAGARLKHFLQGKLQSLGRRCWTAWLHHHDNIAAENMKNNDSAKKVALLLEKLARSLIHRQFIAFVRMKKLADEERAAMDAINARLAMMDEFNKAKLRIFLDGKRLGKMSTFFKFWTDVWRNSALYALQDEIDREDKAIKDLLDSISNAEAMLGGQGAKLQGKAGELSRTKDEIAAANARANELENELRRVRRKIGETEDLIADEKKTRAENAATIRALENDLDMTNRQRDKLAGELAGIAGEVGVVHNDSQW